MAENSLLEKEREMFSLKENNHERINLERTILEEKSLKHSKFEISNSEYSKLEEFKAEESKYDDSKYDEFTFEVSQEEKDLRLDVFLSLKLEKTRSFVQKLIDDEMVLVSGKTKKKNYKLSENELVSVTVPLPQKTEILPENIPLDIVYEDEHLLVVDKPKGMVVHPAPAYYSGTLVNALMYHCGNSLSGINGYIRPGIVHRIDKDTSGLLIVAKNDEAHQGLAKQISVHSFTRMYEAIVVGNIKEDKFKIDLPIGRHPTDRKKMAVVYENSRNAVTNVEVLARFGGYTHIRLFLETGRTHQIRVHMSHKGHPVLGDMVYGKESKKFPSLKGQCLWAKYISFIHPIYKSEMSFISKTPEYFSTVLNALNNANN